MRIATSVRRLEAYVPGEQPKVSGIIKLNTNENPYPPSPQCERAVEKFRLSSLRKYPDPMSGALRGQIAERFGTTPECVFVGNGSDEILSLSARAFVEDDEIIASLDPSYSLYKTLAAIRNVKWMPRPEKGRLDPKTSLFLWTNPNAPTGRLEPVDSIRKFAQGFNGVVIVDEAYADFARWNAMDLAVSPKNKNIIVMRTFSKSYSLAGLRVGFCVGPADLIAALDKVRDSYNVDMLAQVIAAAAFADRAYHSKTTKLIVATRDRFAASLKARGWDVIDSDANFVFAKPPAPATAQRLFADLREKNIFVRYFPGKLTGDRLRITIGTEGQMRKFLKAVDELHGDVI